LLEFGVVFVCVEGIKKMGNRFFCLATADGKIGEGILDFAILRKATFHAGKNALSLPVLFHNEVEETEPLFQRSIVGVFIQKITELFKKSSLLSSDFLRRRMR